MLDAFSSLNPAWTGSVAFGDLVRCHFPDPLDYTRRAVRLCAVMEIDSHHGAVFLELVPAVPAAEQAPGTGDIPASAAQPRCNRQIRPRRPPPSSPSE